MLQKFTDNNNEKALISSDYYIICLNKTHQGPCARVDFDQVKERCSGTHLFQLGGVPHGVDVVVGCLNLYCPVSGPAIGDLFDLFTCLQRYSSSLLGRRFRRLSVGLLLSSLSGCCRCSRCRYRGRDLSLPSSLCPGIGGLSLLFSYFCKQRIWCHFTGPTFTKPPVT